MPFQCDRGLLMPEYKDRHFLSSTRKLHPQLSVPGPPERLRQSSHKENVIARSWSPTCSWGHAKMEWRSRRMAMLWEGIALEALSGDRKAQAPLLGKGFSFPVAHYVGVGGGGGGGWRGWRAFSYWSGLEGTYLLLGREVSSEHLSTHCVILGTSHSISLSQFSHLPNMNNIFILTL